jgi:hypothetical protein
VEFTGSAKKRKQRKKKPKKQQRKKSTKKHVFNQRQKISASNLKFLFAG